MGGGNGRRLLRAFGSRAISVSDQSSFSSTSVHLKCFRKPKSTRNLPFSSFVNSHYSDDFCMYGFEDEGSDDSSGYHLPLAHPPAQQEVNNVLSSLRRVFCPTNSHVTPDGSEMKINDSRMQLYSGIDQVRYAFHLLKTEPTVQRMVQSILSDEAVWDVILNNKVVREVHELCSSNSDNDSESSYKSFGRSEPHHTTNVVMWMFDSSKAKFKKLIEIITKIMNDMFQCTNHKMDEANFTPVFVERLRASFMISIMVMFVVMVNRPSMRA